VRALGKSLSDRSNPLYFRQLLRGKGTLFAFLLPTNRKVKAKEPASLHYPGFFEWAQREIAPWVEKGVKEVWPTLQAAWNPIAEKVLSEEEAFGPDEILAQMRRAVQLDPFANRVRQKYKAVMIDEFQDTDEMQWDIFHHLFLKELTVRALYLVGDPKQAIYRFRKADIYTYLKARDLLGEAHLYHLDTNFRSSPSLIGALNALFNRNWLQLPKMKQTLPYHTVRAGISSSPPFQDEKGALHFFCGKGESKELFDSTFLPYIVGEIEQLRQEIHSLSRFAILVKDRYQAERVLTLLRSRNIAAIARSHTPIGQTFAFQALKEVFDATLSPHDASAAKIVAAGPFRDTPFSFVECKAVLHEQGLVPFCRFLLNGLVWDEGLQDLLQIFEMLFTWEKKHGFSFEGLQLFLEDLKQLPADEGGRRRMEVDEDAVQVMTLHMSKGLEFDVVFALALSSRTPEPAEEMEELNAEKLRQLYVAMTRAQRRLYVPMVLEEKGAEVATHSPMELFAQHLIPDELFQIGRTQSLTLEHLLSPHLLKTAPTEPQQGAHRENRLQKVPFQPCFLHSFTTLAREEESDILWTPLSTTEFTPHTLPRGKETGVMIHTIFERLFQSQEPIWKEKAAVTTFVREQLRFSPLLPWEEAIASLVSSALTLPLEGNFSLSQVEVENVAVEVEFVFDHPPHFMKGFIDLVFCYRGHYYFLDWKTNWLGTGDEFYQESHIQLAMKNHDYYLQAAIYKEALNRFFPHSLVFGGAFYFFLRGGACHHFFPDSHLLQGADGNCL
jgi:exodeoxyribonuclease V beta subunit